MLLHEVVTGETPNQRKMLRPLRHALTALLLGYLSASVGMMVDPVVDLSKSANGFGVRANSNLNLQHCTIHLPMALAGPLRNVHRVCATCGAAALHATLDSGRRQQRWSVCWRASCCHAGDCCGRGRALHAKARSNIGFHQDSNIVMPSGLHCLQSD